MTAPPLYASFTPTDELYVLGPLTAPLLTLNEVDDFGCAWVCPEPDGWDAPTVTSPIDQRQDGPGGYLGESTLDPRTLTFDGAVSCPSVAAARAARKRLTTALLGNLTGLTQYTHLADEPAKSLFVRPATGKPRIAFTDDGYALVFSFVLVAEYPLKVGASSTYGPVRLPSATGDPGRQYPRIYPVQYGAGVTARLDTVVVPNVGDEAADVTYTLSGPVPQPVIYLTTGEYLGLSGTLAATDVMVADTRAGTIKINGVNRPDVLLTGSTFPLIPGTRTDPATGVITPGGTEVRLRSAAGGTDPAAGLLVTTASTWK